MFIILGNFVLKGIQKLLGQKNYAKLEAIVLLIRNEYESRRNQLHSYYDARVDKQSPYYKPIVRVWRFAGMTILYICIYLFVIETNIFG